LSAPTPLDAAVLAQAVTDKLAARFGLGGADRGELALLLHDDRLLGAREVGALLGVSVRTIDALVVRGELPRARWVGTQRRWRFADVRAVIAGLPSAPEGGRS
jgi:excisionase family DNA binding protein